MPEIPAAFVFHAVDIDPVTVKRAWPCPVCGGHVGLEGGVMLLGQAAALAFAIHEQCLAIAVEAQLENLEQERRRRASRNN